ncbi:MAG: erythromycin esterase family protein [Bacteroidota bacterium]
MKNPNNFSFLFSHFSLVFLIFFLCSVDAHSQHLSAFEQHYLKKNSTPIELKKGSTTYNWKALKKQLKGKNLVMLGEFNHGSKEIFELRNDLIQYLHHELGFTTILFESGIGELAVVDFQKEELSTGRMTAGLLGGWRTQAFAKLMSYIKNNDLSLSGFDVQRTGNNFSAFLEKSIKDLNLDQDRFIEIEKRFGTQKSKLTNRKVVYDSVKVATEQLINDYQLLINQLDNKQNGKDKPTLLFIRRTLINRIAYLTYFLDFAKDKDWNQRWTTRDSIMASNVDWLINKIYPEEKVIIIAHNFHIAKYNEKQEVMGEFLKEKYSKEMYSLGVFAGKGSYADNFGREKQLSPISTEKLDLKRVIQSLNHSVNFIPIPDKQNQKNSWLFNPIIVNDTFIDLYNSNEMNLAKHFDGLLLMDEVSPPDKL